MLWRLAEHYVAFRQPKSHKYQILAEAKQKGHAVQFDVVCYATSSKQADVVEEIGEAEGCYIRQYLPALIIEWVLVALLLVILIPLGVI